MTLREPDEMTSVARFQRLGPIRRRGSRVELAGLGHRPARQLRARDPRRKPEIVLDPPRRAGLTSEGCALDDEGVEPFGRSVDGRAEARGAAADDKEVDLLP